MTGGSRSQQVAMPAPTRENQRGGMGDSPAGERLLVLTPLNVLGSPNSRTHHLVQHLAPQFRETFAISRSDATHLSRRNRWRALFCLQTIIRREGTLRWISLMPWGSVRHGLGHHLLKLANPFAAPPGVVRRVARRVLSLCGMALELGILPSYLVTLVTRVRRRSDVAIGQGPWEVTCALLLRALGCARTVVYDDIDYAPGFLPVAGLRRRLIAALERHGICRADLVISVGERLASLRRAQGARHVLVIPNGVDVSTFAKARAARGQRGRRRPTLIYTGYLGAWAGMDLVLEATARAARDVPELRLILLGHGTPLDLEALHAGIRDRGLGGVAEYRGEVPYDALPDPLAVADIGLIMFRPLDLTRYAFPLKAVEYMAAGLPVLATADTEAADLVVRTGAGEAVPFEAGALASAAVRLLRDPLRRTALGEAGSRAAQDFDWHALMAQHMAAIREAMERSLGRDSVSVRTGVRA